MGNALCIARHRNRTAGGYGFFRDLQDDAKLRRWNLWGYVDARDVALSCELALTADVSDR